MEIEIVQSEIVVYTPAKVNEERHYGWHIHDALEFIYCIDGNMVISVPDNEYHISSGDIILINSRIPHKTDTEKNSSVSLLQTELNFEESSALYPVLSQHFSQNDATHIFKNTTQLNEELVECLKKINTENRSRGRSYEIFIKSFVINIYAILYRNNILRNPYDEFNKKYIQKILPAINYINENYSSNISLSHISELMNYDKYYFCKIFKSALNLSFVQYLNLVRLNKAAELLQSTSKTISEISTETGFSTLEYFIRNFKIHFGCTPNFYRKIKLN